MGKIRKDKKVLTITALLTLMTITACSKPSAQTALQNSLSSVGNETRYFGSVIEEKFTDNGLGKENTSVGIEVRSVYIDPYVDDDTIASIAKAISETIEDTSYDRTYADVQIFCYDKNIMTIGVDDGIKEDEILNTLKSNIAAQKNVADYKHEQFDILMSKYPEVNTDEEGYYFILDSSDFETSAGTIVSIVEIGENSCSSKIPNSMNDYCFRDIRTNTYYGYTGEAYKVYKDSVSDENLLLSRYFMEYHDIYGELYKNTVYDFSSYDITPETIGDATTYRKVFTNMTAYNNKDEYYVYMDIDELNEDFRSIDEVADISFEIYSGIKEANELNNITNIVSFDLYAQSTPGEGYEISETHLNVDFTGDYSRDDFLKMLNENLQKEYNFPAV